MDESHTKNMVETYERSFGTEAFLKLCISNIHKILVEKEIITEERLSETMRMEISFDIQKRVTEHKGQCQPCPDCGRLESESLTAPSQEQRNAATEAVGSHNNSDYTALQELRAFRRSQTPTHTEARDEPEDDRE